MNAKPPSQAGDSPEAVAPRQTASSEASNSPSRSRNASPPTLIVIHGGQQVPVIARTFQRIEPAQREATTGIAPGWNFYSDWGPDATIVEGEVIKPTGPAIPHGRASPRRSPRTAKARLTPDP